MLTVLDFKLLVVTLRVNSLCPWIIWNSQQANNHLNILILKISKDCKLQHLTWLRRDDKGEKLNHSAILFNITHCNYYLHPFSPRNYTCHKSMVVKFLKERLTDNANFKYTISAPIHKSTYNFEWTCTRELQTNCKFECSVLEIANSISISVKLFYDAQIIHCSNASIRESSSLKMAKSDDRVWFITDEMKLYQCDPPFSAGSILFFMSKRVLASMY